MDIAAEVQNEFELLNTSIRELEEKYARAVARCGELEREVGLYSVALRAAQEVVGQCDCIMDEDGKTKRRYYKLRDAALTPTPTPEAEESS